MNWGVFSKYRNELYGLSIIAIIVLHFFQDVLGSGSDGIMKMIGLAYTSIIGSTGVDIFLFLSGMGLYFSLKKKYDLKRFYKNRLKRILVPYILLAIPYWFYIDFIYSHHSIGQFLLDFSLLSFWTQGETRFWYVALIILCYVLFPFLFLMLERKGQFGWVVMPVTALLIIVVAILFPAYFSMVEIGLTRLLVFEFGAWAGQLIYQKKKFRLGWLLLLGLVARGLMLIGKIKFADMTLMTTATPLNRWVISWCALGIMLALVAIMERKKLEKCYAFLRLVGDYSLELYMMHVSVRTIMNRLGYETYLVRYYLIVIALSGLLSILLRKGTNLVLRLVEPSSNS